jgi:hypothetical protein
VSKKPWIDSRKPRLEIQRYPRTDDVFDWVGYLLAVVIVIAVITLLAATASPSCDLG